MKTSVSKIYQKLIINAELENCPLLSVSRDNLFIFSFDVSKTKTSYIPYNIHDTESEKSGSVEHHLKQCWMILYILSRGDFR